MSKSILDKYKSIDQTKISKEAKTILLKIKVKTRNFKETTPETNKVFNTFYSKLQESKPQAIKGYKAPTKATPKAATKPAPKASSKGTSAAQLLKEAKKRRANQGISTSKSDIEKDAVRPAKPKGYRITDGTNYPYVKGNKYWEGRENRLDRKQPPKKYPKLEHGGYMEDGGSVNFDYELKIQPDYKYKNIANRWLEDNEKDSLKYKLAVLLLRGKRDPDEILGIKEDSRYARLLRSLEKAKGESKHEMQWRTENYTLNDAEKWTIESLGDIFYVHANTNKMEHGGYMAKGGMMAKNEDIHEKVLDYLSKHKFNISAFGEKGNSFKINDKDFSIKDQITIEKINSKIIVSGSSNSNIWYIFMPNTIAKGGYMAKGGNVTPKEKMIKELHKLQRDLNSSRLSQYREGDTSEEEMARKRERDSKLARFNEILEVLNQDDKKMADGGYMAKGGGIPNNFAEIIYIDNDGTKEVIAKFKRAIDAYISSNHLNATRIKFGKHGQFVVNQNPKGKFEDGGMMAKGGETEEGVNLFEDYDDIPDNVQKILDKYEGAFEDGEYKGLNKALKELNKIGYTFEYGLDGGAYDLRKIGQLGKSEVEYKDGGMMAKGGQVSTRELNKKIKDWYIKNYPTDDLGEEINDTITFKGFWGYTSQGYDVYEVLGVGDSVIRERVQERLSQILGKEKMADGGYMAKGGGIPNNFAEIIYIDNDGTKEIIAKFKRAIDAYISSNHLNATRKKFGRHGLFVVNQNPKGKFENGGMMAKGGEVGQGFLIREMREKLNRMFPDSFGFTVGNVSKEGNKTLNSAALIVDLNDPYRGLEDKDIQSKLFFPQYKIDHNINFRMMQGGENTYFYFELESEKGDEYIGQFGFKDSGDVPASYITSFIAFLMEQYGLPFQIEHQVMAYGGKVGEPHRMEIGE